MANQPDRHQRSDLPIPARAYTGLVKYDAKDPEVNSRRSSRCARRQARPMSSSS